MAAASGKKRDILTRISRLDGVVLDDGWPVAVAARVGIQEFKNLI